MVRNIEFNSGSNFYYFLWFSQNNKEIQLHVLNKPVTPTPTPPTKLFQLLVGDQIGYSPSQSIVWDKHTLLTQLQALPSHVTVCS